MKEDDVTIVMYKIMSYLYKCKKEGIEPRESGYNAEKLQINKAYWDICKIKNS